MSRLGLERRVRFLGHREDVADLMAAVDAVLLPSRREGFPGVVVEAMALGAPVVAFDVPGMREAGGELPFLAPPGDVAALGRALDVCLGDRAAAETRALAGRRRFEDRFTTPAVAAQTVAFYERALGRRSTATLTVANVLNSNHRRGAEAFAVDLGRALADRGDRVRTVALREATEPPTFAVDALGGPRAKLPLVAWRLRRAGHRADVLIGHGGQTLFAGAFASVLGPRFVYRVIGEPHHWIRGGARALLVRSALGRAARVVVYYPSAADRLVSDLGVDRRRIAVLPKGLDTSSPWPATPDERVAARRRLGLPADDARPVVLYLGALVEVKNVDQVVAAVAAVPDALLLVVGNGPGRGALERERDRGALGDRLVLVGASDTPVDAYHAADVVVLTSRSEGAPTVLLEAALAALPVVATDVGGVGSVVDDGETGLLVPVDDIAATADAIVAAIKDRDRLGAAARARCLERHDIHAVAAGWEALLHVVVSGHGTGAGADGERRAGTTR